MFGSGRNGDDPSEQRRKLLFVHRATHNLERRGRGDNGVGRFEVVRHSGMFPCFLGGSDARSVRKARSARTTWARVSDGAMTAST